MECKSCGAFVQDDGIFCSICGSRVDGMKNCPNCDKLINENSIYCTYCGNRVDGKVICPKCGEIIEDKFCAKCGTAKEPNKSQNTKKSVVNGKEQSSTFKKINRFLAPGMLLGAMLALFICSFFVGTSMTALGVSEKYTAFHYFGDAYDGLKWWNELFTYEEAMAGLKLTTIMSTVFVGANLLISFSMLLVGTIKYLLSIKKNQTAKIGTFASISFASFLTVAIYLLACSTGGINGLDVELLSIKMSAGSLCGIIIGGILILAGIVLNKFNVSNSNVLGLIKDVCFTALLLVCAFLVFGFVSGNVLEISGIEEDVSIKCSSPTWFSLIFLSLEEELIDPEFSLRSQLTSLSMVNYIFFVIMLICLAVVIASLLKSQLNEKSSNALTVSMFSAITVVAITCLVLLISSGNVAEEMEILSGDPESILATTGAPIICLVFAVIGLVVSIVQAVLGVKKSKA